MAHIYAFQDASGHWHGDIDTPLLEAHPGHGTFTYRPVPGTPEAASPFAGQTLKVLVAATDLDPGPVTYQLDDGGQFQPTWYVYTLLATPMGSQPAPRTPTHDNTKEPYLNIALIDNGRRYLMTATRNDGDALVISLTTCTLDGQVQGELNGTIADADLPGLARVLQTAITTSTPSAQPAPSEPNKLPALKRGAQWSAEERTRLIERYHQDKDFNRLGHEFGRSALSIQYQLFQLGLTQRPQSARHSVPVPPPPQPTGPTHEELRKTHARSHTPWTDLEEQQLALRCEQGATAEEMSAELERTVGAIESRLRLTGAQGPAADKARMQHF